MNTAFYIWMAISFLFVLLELSYFGLFLFLSLACGAFLTAFFSLIISFFAVQFFLFLVMSIISLIIMIKRINKIVDKDYVYQKTNTQALLGRHAFVMKEILPESVGEVKIGGELWSARSVHGNFIASGSRVIVIQVKGAHVVVEVVASINKN